MSYAWVITKDHLFEPGSDSRDAAGIAGPAQATDRQVERARSEGTPFRMYDDDGVLYYSGRCWSSDGTDSEDGFGPLDDFGRPDSGATEIRYRQPGGSYVTL